MNMEIEEEGGRCERNGEIEKKVEKASCVQVFTIFHAVLFTVRIISLHQFYAFKRFTVTVAI